MQEALKKSNTNVLELKETINELILKEKKLKNKIKELDKDNDNLKQIITKNHNTENELRVKNEQLKMDNFTLNQNISMYNDLQKKYEELIRDNKLIRKDNEETERRRDKLQDEIERKNQIIE